MSYKWLIVIFPRYIYNFRGTRGLKLRKCTCHYRGQVCLYGQGGSGAVRKGGVGGREEPSTFRITSLGRCLRCLSTKWDLNIAHKLLWSNQGALKEIRLGLKALGLWVNKNFNKNGKYSPGPWYSISLGCWRSISQSYNLSDVHKGVRESENCVGQRRFQKQPAERPSALWLAFLEPETYLKVKPFPQDKIPIKTTCAQHTTHNKSISIHIELSRQPVVPIYHHPHFMYEKPESQRGGGRNLVPGSEIPTLFLKFLSSFYILNSNCLFNHSDALVQFTVLICNLRR